MGRYAKIGQTVENLKQMIKDNGGLKAIIDSYKLKVRKDLHKVHVGHDIVGFVSENEVPTYEMIGDGLASFPVAWCFTHGKDELWVEFVLYIGQDGNLRAYIPTHGNNVDGHRAIPLGATTSSKLDRGKMRDSVVNRISVKGEASGNVSANVKLTFRQLIQSLKDYNDQYASVKPYAKGAENPYWGIQHIWFNDGVLCLGQHDDEGLTCDTIAERIEECVPEEMLDYPAVVKIGTVGGDEDNRQIYNADGEPASARTVLTSEVKANTYDPDDEFDDEFAEDGEDDSWFCKWILKLTN